MLRQIGRSLHGSSHQCNRLVMDLRSWPREIRTRSGAASEELALKKHVKIWSVDFETGHAGIQHDSLQQLHSLLRIRGVLRPAASAVNFKARWGLSFQPEARCLAKLHQRWSGTRGRMRCAQSNRRIGLQNWGLADSLWKIGRRPSQSSFRTSFISRYSVF